MPRPAPPSPTARPGARARPAPPEPKPQPPQDAAQAEAALFRAAVRDARPLPDPGRIEPPRARLRPVPLQRLADDKAVLSDSLSDAVQWDLDRLSGEQLAYKRDGVSPQVFRKLRRGHWIVQGEVDLHGLTRDEARVHLAGALAEFGRRGARCVRVIHGKGLRSRNREPVLKAKVAHWLAQRDDVLAYCEAPARDGGGGAVLVLLRGR